MHSQIILALTLSTLIGVTGNQGGHERLYVHANQFFYTIDPETGTILGSETLQPFVLNSGFVYEDGLLYFIDQNIESQRDFLRQLHPATGETVIVGATGYSYGFAAVSLTKDPTTGQFYATFASGLFAIDKNTGKASFIGRMDNLTAITAIAIDSAGQAFAVSATWTAFPKPRLFRLDLTTAVLTLIGELPLRLSSDFDSLAFDLKNRLWGQVLNFSNPTFSKIYIIDVNTLEISIPFTHSFTAGGLAFGPAPRVDSYCTGKLNSAGCVPTVVANGHPSASAPSGFSIGVRGMLDGHLGILMHGTNGKAALPFQGGLLCLAPPLGRAMASSSGAPGPDPCSTGAVIDFNTVLFGHFPQPAGTVVQCQWWGRDPGLVGPDDSQLSNALEFTLMP